MIVQISGPMAGYEGFNKAAFFKAEERLKKLKRVKCVINPAEIPDDTPYAEALMDCLNMLPEVDVVFCLRGYQLSPGAKAETALAAALRIPCIDEDDPEAFSILEGL